MRFLKIIILFVLALFWTNQIFAGDTTEPLRLEVIDPYVEMHSGPGRGYPIFYVIEQGEKVEVVTRRPGWYEVRTKNGKVGWTTASQISRTIQLTGEPADLPTVSYGDYLKNRWRVGFNTGQFSSGELQSSETFSFTVGYRPLSWLGLEAEGGKIFGDDIKGSLYGVNFVIEPFSHWQISPVLLLGSGVIKIESQPKLTPLLIDASSYNHYGFGLNYYLGRNFLFKTEYRSYAVSADNNNVRLNAWTLGFNSFF
jgi:uncharacterized protein YgiM (DUF1202 family)